MKRETRWLAAIAVLVLTTGAAQAQLSPSPGAVNDCTKLTDPRRLQECLERNTGVDNQFAPALSGPRTRGPFLEDKGSAESGNPGPPP